MTGVEAESQVDAGFSARSEFVVSHVVASAENCSPAAKRPEPGDVWQRAMLGLPGCETLEGSVGQVVVDVDPVDSSKTPKFERQIGTVKRYAHALAKCIDNSFDAAVTELLFSIGSFLFDAVTQEDVVGRCSEVFACTVRAKNCRFAASSCEDTLQDRCEFVLGLMQLDVDKA